jgi:hypothetical protein
MATITKTQNSLIVKTIMLPVWVEVVHDSPKYCTSCNSDGMRFGIDSAKILQYADEAEQYAKLLRRAAIAQKTAENKGKPKKPRHPAQIEAHNSLNRARELTASRPKFEGKRR